MPALTDDQKQEAERLIKRLEDDDIQRQLRAGFEQDFANSILEQWHGRHWLSFEGRNGKRSQIEIVRGIIADCEQRGSSAPSARPSHGRSRRYEGFSR